MLNWTRPFYDLAYRVSKPRWDTDVPPPELVSLVSNGGSGGRALDLGCGTGTNAIYLAQHGFTTVGVDFSPKAVGIAHKKAKRANVPIELQVGDVTRLASLHHPFDLTIDVGCFHGLDAVGRKRYAQHLARLTHPGSKFLLWAFDSVGLLGIGATREQIQQTFGESFKLTRVERGSHVPRRDAAWYWLVRQPTWEQTEKV